MKSYLLAFRTPLHLGTWRDDHTISEKVLHSDTLYAAIFAMWARLGNADWIQEALNDKSFAISSAFPFVRQSTQSVVYLLPKPFGRLFPQHAQNGAQAEDSTERKKNKKVAYFDAQDLKQWAENGKLAPIDKFNRKGTVYSTTNLDAIPDKLVLVQTQERVSIAQDPAVNPEPFSLERISFADETGLYLLVKGTDTTQKRVAKGLNLLGLEGIGSDRAVGNGQFSVTIGPPFPWPNIQGAKRQLLLSLYLPTDKAEFAKCFGDESLEVGYDLMRRGGWVTTPDAGVKRKNSIHFLVPGSVTRATSTDQIIGTYVDLAPNPGASPHPIWRIGRAICYPIAH
jgi:CRISPR type III-A-associated RAMP protein Csm4